MNKSAALLATLFYTSLFVFQSLTPAYSVPPALNIQGRLTNENGVNRDGNFTMVFAIYGQASGGSNLWSKSYTGVQVRNGNFSVQVGNPDGIDDTSRVLADVFDGSNRWLGISVAGEPELIPRQALVTVPHAFVADKLTTPTVPIGTILDWYRPSPTTPLPEGFQICDGNLISDAASPMNGQSTPNLTDKITYGVTLTRNDGRETGGSNVINLQHSHAVNSHSHSMSHTHGFSGDTSGTTVGATVQGGGGASIVHESHTHHYSGSTSDASTTQTGFEAPGTNIQLSSTQDIRQAYVGVVKIIRIK